MSSLSTLILLLIVAGAVFVLDRGAQLLVREAIALSLRWGLSTAVIGATVVSLGTTLPEAAVSVFAALKGDATIALGNAVGSIICDTGLILGVATLINPLRFNRKIVNRQGWIQLGAGILLVIACLPFTSLGSTFVQGGQLLRITGFIFVGLLVWYLWGSIARLRSVDGQAEREEIHDDKAGIWMVVLKFVIGIVLVLVSSRILIPAAQELAVRMHVPPSIIAATLIALGTSLPEFATAITAARKGHGELAIGNIIGADILNVLFVAGLSAAVTPAGLAAPAHFFKFLFPAMLAVLIIFRLGTLLCRERLGRTFGAILLLVYLAITGFSLTLGLAAH
jgi:cation:H+ antiporter